jgi:hypothetical protein
MTRMSGESPVEQAVSEQRTAGWQALLVGPAADEARQVAHAIADWVEGQPASARPGFAGDGSAALLLAACERGAAAARLEQALVTTLDAPTSVALFDGITGLSWLLPQLADGDGVARALEQYDAMLIGELAVARWEGRHDLVGGLAGVGVMAAARRDERAQAIADRVLFHLESTAQMTDTGATWRTAARFVPEPARHLYPDGRIDLGVAHGVAGVVGMLAQFVAAGVEPVRSRRLLDAAAAWLLDMVGGDATRFELTWPLDVPRLRRIGWCSGHTGVAAVLLRAGRALGQPALETRACELLRKLARPTASDGPLDAGVCHGAAGMAQLYSLAFQLTGDSELRAAAMHWLAELVQLRTHAAPPGYRYMCLHDDAPRWGEDGSLLSGAAGSALVLLAACEPREPEWTRLFVA